MPYILLMVLVASLLLLWMASTGERREYFDLARVIRTCTTAYVIFIGLILCLLLGRYLGWPGRPRIPIEKLYQVSHVGYYGPAEGEIIFNGKPDSAGFKHSNLAEGEEIAFSPVWRADAPSLDISAWSIRYRAFSHILRVNGECINAGGDRWLKPGEAVVFIRAKNGQGNYYSVQWKTRHVGFWIFRKLEDLFYLDYGRVFFSRVGEPILRSDRREPLLLSHRILIRESLPLFFVIRPRAEQDKITIPFREWWEIASNVRLVRRQSNEVRSPLGVFIPDEAFDSPTGTADESLHIFRSFAGSSRLARLSKQTSPAVKMISSHDSVFYGFSRTDGLQVLMSNRVVQTQSPFLSEIVELKLSPFPHWPLPPDFQEGRQFIVTSSREQIALDGYFVEGMDPQNPFYAKAEFVKRGRQVSWVLNDGRNKTTYGDGDIVRLGNFQGGVLLSLTKQQAAIPRSGLFAILSLLLLTIIFIWIFLREENIRPRLDAAWAVVWGSSLTILSMRLILAFRASLMPPPDAGPTMIRNVFHKSLIISQWGLLLIPLSFLLVRFIVMKWEAIENVWRRIVSRLPRRRREAVTLRARIRAYFGAHPVSGPIICGTLFTISYVIILWFIGKIGTNESFLGRISVDVHIVAILILALLARFLITVRSMIGLFFFSFNLIATPFLVALFVDDIGFIIYGASFALSIMILWLLRAGMVRKWLVWTIVGALLVTLIPVLAPQTLNVSFIQKIVSVFPRGLEKRTERVFYRFVEFQKGEERLLESVDEPDINKDAILKNSHQNWQMLLYAAEGIRQPRGYGEAPLTARGMTYPTTMTDCVFSIYLLSEHGGVVGFVLVLIYLLLGGAILFGAINLFDEYAHRQLPLAAVGMFFIFNSVYMAAANLGLTVFTGQNMPLLGLYSRSDIVQGLVMLSLISLLLRKGLDYGDSPSQSPPVRTILLMTVAFMSGIIIFGIGPRLAKLGAPNSPFIRDHNFDRDFIEVLRNHLPDPEDVRFSGRSLQLREERLGAAPHAQLMAIERIYVDQFNWRYDKYNPNGGLYYLDRLPPEPLASLPERAAVRINENYFVLGSPFKEEKLWPGRILASDAERAPTLIALGQPWTITLSQSGHAESIFLDGYRTRRMVPTNNKLLIRARDLAFFELIRTERDGVDTLTLTPKNVPGWNLYLDGEKMATEEPKPRDLSPMTLIAIESPKKGKPILFNLIYLGNESPVLSLVQWRNGASQRLFPTGERFSMAFALGLAADQMTDPSATMPDSMDLSLDYSLHDGLQGDIANYAARNGFYRKRSDLPDTPNLALTVMDTFSGKIMALPSWPAFDPGEKEFRKRFAKMSYREQSKLLKNNNFRNHAVGSTIKPLVFGSIATGFSSEMDPARLTIYHRKEPLANYPKDRYECPHSQMGRIPFSVWDCLQPEYSESTSKDYLVYSRNYVEAFMGMLGMLLNPKDWDLIRQAAPNAPDIAYGSKKYALDFTRVKESPFTLNDARPIPRTSIMNETILFKQMKALYEIGLSERPEDMQQEYGPNFLPFFFGPDPKDKSRESDFLKTKKTALQRNLYMDEIMPDVVNFAPKDFQEIRGSLISFFIGGGSCRWNNVRMVESLTRVAIGRKVMSSLQAGQKQDAVQLMPKPLVGDGGWRTTNVIYPLEAVGEIGTAAAFGDMVREPYKMICKTGTINERSRSRESEMLFLIIGRWNPQKGQFVPGETLSAYLYMQDAKLEADPHGFKKFEFARPMIQRLLDRLKMKAI